VGYWNGGGMWGLGGFPMELPPSKNELPVQRQHHHRDDKHLRSTKSVAGYAIQASDGEIGSVSSFMVNDMKIAQVPNAPSGNTDEAGPRWPETVFGRVGTCAPSAPGISGT